jgi:hypothetical protein
MVSNDAVVAARLARVTHDRIAINGGVSEFHVLRGAGHMLFHQQAPELVDLIVEHLRTSDHAIESGVSPPNGATRPAAASSRRGSMALR